MSNKDAWDKFEIIFKSAILGLIPLVITLGANTVAQSIKRGEIIQSSVSSLVKDQETERDIALIALDTAFPINRDWRLQRHPDDDEVVKIIEVLLGRSILSPSSAQALRETGNFDVINDILDRRGGKDFPEKLFKQVIADKTSIATSELTALATTKQQQVVQSNISEAISILQGTAEPIPTSENPDNCPSGIRLAFIQYGQESSRQVAEEIQKRLSNCGILAPGIEQVNGILQNDIRYATPADQQAAKDLQAYIEDYLRSTQPVRSFASTSPIDLSDAGYNSATGQFEIWLE